LNTGLQISGKFTRTILNEDGKVVFFKTEGATSLAYREKELIGHGIENHPDGFSSPLGKLKNINLAIEDMGPVDMKAYNFYDGKWLSFEFESGIRVEGLNVTGIRNLQGKLMLIRLTDCTVTYKDEFLYLPEYGAFDMVVGSEVVSAFAGAADYNSFPNLYEVSQTLTVQPEKTAKTQQLEAHYQTVRTLRETKQQNDALLREIFDQLAADYSGEWLLPLEILEISGDNILNNEIRGYLVNLAERHPTLNTLILEGIEMLEEPITA